MESHYANPRSKEEHALLEHLVEHQSIPLDFLPRLNKIYGVPCHRDVPEDIFDRVDAALQVAEQHGSPPQKRFHQLRKVLLKEYYPGDKGYQAVQGYWAEQREILAMSGEVLG